MSTVRDVTIRLSKFLETRVEGDQGGGWVAPSQADFKEFYDIITAIRDLKWARDGDGNPTIEIRLTDRSIGPHPRALLAEKARIVACPACGTPLEYLGQSHYCGALAGYLQKRSDLL